MAEQKLLTRLGRVKLSIVVLGVVVFLLQTGCSYLVTKEKVPMPPKMWWENSMTARYVADPDNGEKSLVRSSTFFSTDPEIISMITLRNVSDEHTLRWEWREPSGKIYYVTGKQPILAKEGMYTNEVGLSHKILINGDKSEKMYGDWLVNIYLDDQKIVTQNFTLKSEANIKGAWFIIDDYLDKSAYTSTETFSQFKSSKFLDDLLSEKAGKQMFRFDLIRGAYTIKVSEDYRVKAKSSFTRNSEVKSLVSLSDHDIDEADITWNLHLFLARKTSGNIENMIADQMIERLRHLNVEKIFIWEFCNHQPTEKTVYQSIFEKFKGEIELSYQIVYDSNMFEDVYRKIYYQ